MALYPLSIITQNYVQHFIYLNGRNIVILMTIFFSQITECDLLLVIKEDSVKMTFNINQTFLITQLSLNGVIT